MAARRARLQIKPNIGGPKGAAKPAVAKKPAESAPAVETVKTTTDVSKTKATIGDSVEKTSDQSTSEKSTTTSDKDPIRDTKIDENGANIKSQESTKSPRKDRSSDKEDGSKSDSISSPPARARLRRFGKVNIAAITGVKTTVDTSKTPSSAQAGDSKKELLHDKDKKDESKDKSDKSTGDSGTSEIKSPTATGKTVSIPRRARFPKAKPNIVDASKRRTRPFMTEDVGEESSKASLSASKKDSSSIPSIIVTPADNASPSESTSATSRLSATGSADKPDSGQMTQLQSRPPVPRSPIKTPISSAILASPVKQVHAPDKRQRTVSVSEAPVNKRPKKPKIDAPTDQPPDRATMRMRDLIHWNPRSNPMKPKVKAGTDEVVAGQEKENVAKDRPEPPPPPVAPISEDSNSSMPVPQVTIGPDGNIVINEKSLMVANTDADKGSTEEDGIIDETDMITTYHSFRKPKEKSKRWTKRETAKFYKALGMIGIDFTMIEKLFPKRSRMDIKKKFKMEERKNKPLVDKVLREGIHFDPAIFDAAQNEDESSSEDEEEKKKKKPKKERKERKKNKDPTEPKPKKKPTKRKHKPLNYYEDSHSDEEDDGPPVINATGEDTPWQPACVSQKDGEVVGILMDMSEGRLSTDGSQVENPMSVGSPAKSGAGSPGRTQTHLIPGVQNIITVQTRQLSPLHTGEATRVVNNRLQLNRSQAASRSGISIAQTVQSVVSNSPLTTSVDTTRVVLSPSAISGNSSVEPVSEQVLSESGTSLTQSEAERTETSGNQSVYQQVQPETSTYLDDAVLQLQPNATAEVPEGQDDQYVLVTVVPEGGEDTVIHIYKLHGGSLNQDNVEGFAQNLNASLTSAGSPDVENL